eukprot:1067048-Pyramimonas_sp.AAC.1
MCHPRSIPRGPEERPKKPQEASKRLPRGPQEFPERPPRGLRESNMIFKMAHDSPSPQDRSMTAQDGHGASP